MQDFVFAFDLLGAALILLLWTVYFGVSVWPRWKRSLLDTLPSIRRVLRSWSGSILAASRSGQGYSGHKVS